MDAFTVLADPSRRRILEAIRDRPCTVTMLVDQIGLSQPAVSKQLKVLRESGLVVVTPERQKRWYTPNPKPLAEILEWIEPWRNFWADKLDELERHLDPPDKEIDHE